jgi:hypothetical protein
MPKTSLTQQIQEEDKWLLLSIPSHKQQEQQQKQQVQKKPLESPESSPSPSQNSSPQLKQKKLLLHANPLKKDGVKILPQLPKRKFMPVKVKLFSGKRTDVKQMKNNVMDDNNNY